MSSDALAALCKIARQDSSTIRAALLRSGSVDVLIDACSDVDAARAVLTLSRVRTMHAIISRRMGTLMTNLVHASELGSRGTAAVGNLVRALNVCKRSILVENDQTTLEAVLAGLLAVDLETAILPANELIDALIRHIRTERLLEIVRSSPFGHTYRRCDTRLYLTLAQRVPSLMAQRVSVGLMRDLVAQAPCSDAMELLRRCLDHVPRHAYDGALVDALLDVPQEVFVLLCAMKHCMVDADNARAAATHPRWYELVTFASSRDAPYPCVRWTTLLQCAMHGTLDVETTAKLSHHLREHPAHFSFEKTTDVDALRQIVRCGEELSVADTTLDAYRLKLKDANVKARRASRLQAYGLTELAQPDAFQCPITMETMVDPVVASDGHTYERSSLETLLSQRDHRSPLTREWLDTKIVIPNVNLKKRIRDFEDDLITTAEKVMRPDDELAC